MEDIRRELEDTLATLRGADAMPWPAKWMLETVNMFPALASKLAPDESARLCAALEAEMRR